MTRLILIRHGETDYNLHNRYCGFSDPSLNRNGMRQSEKLSERFTNINVKKVYSSDLKRAVETAMITFTPSGISGSDGWRDNIINSDFIEQLPDFREMNFGVFEGLRYNEILKKYPVCYKKWVNDPANVKIPNGEALEDLAERVRKGLSRILFLNKGSEVALVTHGGPIKIILCDAMGSDLSLFWRVKQDNTGVSLIDYSEELSPAIVKLNDLSHLNMRKAVRQ